MIRRVLFAVTLVLAHSPAWAAEFKTGNVIIDPAIRATTGGAGYLTIRNTGSAPTV